MTGPRRSGSALAVAAALVISAACGARWSDEERAEVYSRHSGVAAGPTVATGSGDGLSSGATAASSPTGADTTPTSAAGGGGSQTTSGGTTAAAKPCAAPSTAPGVTDKEITIGAISSLSGPVPGLGATGAAAIRAYVAYRNATGGVCGRKISLRAADDGSSGSQHRAILQEMIPKVLGIAGGFTIGDIGSADLMASSRLPMVYSPSSQELADLPTVYDLVPAYKDPHAVIGKYRYLVDHGAKKVAIAYLAVAQSRLEANIQRGLMEAAGMKVAMQLELPLSTLSYDSTARSVAASGADYLFFISDVNGEAAMAHAMEDTGYKLKFSEYYNFAYGTKFAELAGSAAEGTLAWLRALPTEEASSNRELAAFVTWMGRVAPNDAIDQTAGDVWAAGKAFFDALEQVPGPISRDALLSALNATQTFDAGGMYGTIQLAAEKTNGCFVGMQVEGGKWRRLVPQTGFLC